jgi:hypothetical protein
MLCRTRRVGIWILVDGTKAVSNPVHSDRRGRREVRLLHHQRGAGGEDPRD